ncbi:MAG: GNAT family N-acetyltransferase [Bacilli bacterium]
MARIELVEFTDKKENYQLMHKWCSQEFIYEWFEQRKLSFDEIENKYKTKLINKKQDLFFINYNKTKIGFVQIYKYDDKKTEELNNYDGIFEYDIFIGESEYLSKGIGTQIVNYINKYIYENYACDCIILRPFERNKRAIRCYEKCNFKKIDEYTGTDTLNNKENIIVLLNRIG